MLLFTLREKSGIYNEKCTFGVRIFTPKFKIYYAS